MRIDQDLCIQCEACVPYCPMRCIEAKEDEVVINLKECVECEVCRNSQVCPTEALVMDPLEYPRNLRNFFSNPLLPHKNTNVPGRGTEEMKTNDVTGRLKKGRVGVAFEMGRPGTGAWMRDVQKITMACAEKKVNFEELNPLTFLMEDKATGKLKEEVLDEKVLSAIIEFDIAQEEVLDLLKHIKEAAKEIDTVFSADFAYRVAADGSHKALDFIQDPDIFISPNGKHNVGLGRPLAKEE
jgi:NAD-dependent dihydropyrimidine dehydrogenase PreA subunit